jgi:hypothetical protein
LLFARSLISELLSLTESVGIGGILALLINIAVATEPGAILARTIDMLSLLQDLLNGSSIAIQPLENDAAVALFMSLLFWFLGHNLAWQYFRLNRIWSAVLPLGFVLIANQFFYLSR